MRNQIIALLTSLALGVAPTAAQANPPLRASSAMVGTAGMLAGTKADRESGVREGLERGGAGEGGMSAGALAGIALGLTGVALATYIATHKHKHCRNNNNDNGNNNNNNNNCDRSPSPR